MYQPRNQAGKPAGNPLGYLLSCPAEISQTLSPQPVCILHECRGSGSPTALSPPRHTALVMGKALLTLDTWWDTCNLCYSNSIWPHCKKPSSRAQFGEESCIVFPRLASLSLSRLIAFPPQQLSRCPAAPHSAGCESSLGNIDQTGCASSAAPHNLITTKGPCTPPLISF